MKGGTIMRQMAGVALAAVAAVAASTNRIFGAENISRHIDRYGGTSGYRQRSRGPQAKPKKKRNMRLVSKRVRRKHRRAA